MVQKISVLIFIAVFLISCQTGKEEAKKFSQEYTKITGDLRAKTGEVKTRDDYVAYKQDLKTQYEALLKKFEKSPAIEEIEILRSKILLKLEKLDEAEEKIDRVLAKKPDLLTEARMVKVQILFKREKFDEAYNIFKEIEPQVKDIHDLFEAYLNFGTKHDDSKIKGEYSNKFLSAKQIPDIYARQKVQIYLAISSVARQQGDYDKARRLLNEGIEAVENEREKAALEKTRDQIDLIGEKAFPISIDTWFNSSPLTLEKLKGKVVVLSFWAPWCPSCRSLTPSIVDIYNENKDREFALIGHTRLYGKYEDDIEDKGKVDKDEEIELIKNYVQRKKVPYPIAIANSKDDYDNYKVPALPTLVFINKKGYIDFADIGSTSVQFVRNKLKTLLLEKE